jgi:hypothetical protein
MYIRKPVRSYKGKTYTNHLLVESVHTPKGPRQRTVCSLGDLSPRPREEWLRILRENDIPCAPVLSRTDFIDHPQVEALAMRRALEDPTLGATIQAGIAVGLERTPGEIAGPAPAVESDREAEGWLSEPTSSVGCGRGAPVAREITTSSMTGRLRARRGRAAG